MTMQVQIRNKGGEDVSIDDCARFSGLMDKALETTQLINEPYVLEITSPGISDQLQNDRDFQTFRGFPIEVNYCNDNDSAAHLQGLLHEKTKDHLQVNIKGRIKRIPYQAVLGVRLISPTG